MIKDTNKNSLTKAELVCENGNYFLNLEYLQETIDKVIKIIPEPIQLNLSDSITINVKDDGGMEHHNYEPFLRIRTFANFGLGDIQVPNSFSITTELVKEKVHEMTLEEIEKELGYKIKIVEEKEHSTTEKDT